MLLISIINIILSSASILGRDFSILLSRISLANLIIILFINYNSTYLLSLEKGISLYNGLYQCNSTSHTFDLFIIILCFLILSMTSYYPRKYHKNYDYPSNHELNFKVIISEVSNPKHTNSELSDSKLTSVEHKPILSINDQFKILEYSLMILFILCGAIFLMSANDIISVFISIELQSYGLYLLSSVYRNSELSTKAGLTYFLLGGLSSCIILLAQGLLYINSGNTNLENLYILSNINTLNIQTSVDNLGTSLFNLTLASGSSNTEPYFDIINGNLDTIQVTPYINISLVILSIGFLFKVSAAPFHFWSPDVYDGVPTLVTTFIAIIAKISIFIFLLELVHYTNNTFTELLPYNWNRNLLLSSLLSLIIGTILGLSQSRIKRLFAYSTISHVGFILLALSVNSSESIQAFIFYILQYSISNLNAFIILVSIGYFLVNYYNDNKEYNELREKNNSPLQLISQIKGLYKLNTMLALSFGITLFSFLGVPPLIGFFGKQMVLSASLDSGYIFMSLVAILTSVISAVYYLVIVKQIFFDENTYKNNIITNSTNTNILKTSTLSSNLTAIISILTLITLVFMFIPNESLNLTKVLSLFMLNI